MEFSDIKSPIPTRPKASVPMSDLQKASLDKHPPYAPRTLQSIEQEMAGHSYELVQYVYHLVNGREEMAQSYLRAWQAEQDMMRSMPIDTLKEGDM